MKTMRMRSAVAVKRRSRRSDSRELSGERRPPRLEHLENRALRSTIPLSGFPAGGFRSAILDEPPPWNVALIVDGQSMFAQAFGESADVMATAPELQLAGSDTVWVAGFIGDTRARGRGGATNEIDIYQIEIPAGDHYSLGLRAIAQRIGSPLDPAVSLFDAAGQLIATNDDALQEGALSDAELFAGVNGGTYYVVVSAGGNTPGRPESFDLITGEAGTASYGTTGQYLLQLVVTPDSEAPQVVQSSIQPGATLDTLIHEITLEFSEPMQLQGLLQGATLVGPGNTSIELVATRYDSTTYEVTYLLRNRPVAGDYTLRLSADVTDYANNPVAGNGMNGSFELSFTLHVDNFAGHDQEANDSPETAQEVGPLYPAELRSGVRMEGVVDAPGDRDLYRFQVVRPGLFTFRLQAADGSNPTGQVTLRDSDGNYINQGFRFPGAGSTMFRFLKPGEFIVEMDGSVGGATGAYTLSIQSAVDHETPLVDSYSGPSVGVLLSTHDRQRAPTVREPAATQGPIVVAVDAIAYSVRSMPEVGSQPVGRAQASQAGENEVAYADASAQQRLFPEGIVLVRSGEPEVHYSVASVSGSFLEPLNETIMQSVTMSDAARQVAAEFRASLEAWGDHAATQAELPFDSPSGVGVEVNEPAGGESGGPGDSLVSEQLAATPTRLALGMVATLTVAGATSTPSPRRGSNWIQQAFDWVGLE